jgi:hypothetical protein
MDARVISTEPVLDLHIQLRNMLFECRSKRDAVSLYHENLKCQNDKYNKYIICLSLFTGFIETLKFQLDLTNKEKHGSTVANVSAICPIFLSTAVAIISSLMKFKKYPEQMELLSTSLIKFNSVLVKIRKLQAELHFLDLDDAKLVYKDSILAEYREALLELESDTYPDIRLSYYAKSQTIILRMLKSERKFKDKVNKLAHCNNIEIISVGSDDA